MLIPICEITVGPGRRGPQSGDVRDLANSIAEVGLINPIMVDQAHTLIAGLHRLEAMKLLGRSEIECTVSDLEGLQAALAEIDENFVRKDLSDDEFRELLLRRKEIYESLHPETKATYDGGAFRGNQHQKVVAAKNAATTKSFVQDTAEKTGKSPRTIRQAIQTTRNLTPEAKEIIKGSKVTKSDALKLSRLAPEQQTEAASRLVSGDIHSVDEYQRSPTGPEPATPPPDAASVPYASSGRHYATFEESIWPISSVVHILDDERYTGTYIMGKREVTEVGGNRVRMKDESQWIKIPDHHTAIISKALFEQVQAKRPRFKCPKKNARTYPLRGKVFCGYCRHAMPRKAQKSAVFFCRYTNVDETAACHGLVIAESELEGLLFAILSKQAQITLNLDSLSNVGQLDIQLAKQAEYDKRIEEYMDKKRLLYEGLVLKQISMRDYKTQKAAVDSELDRLREIHSKLKMQTSRMQMDEKEKSARTKLAREVVGAGGLTAGLADTLIDRVYVYPGNQVEIVWKMKDFCMEE